MSKTGDDQHPSQSRSAWIRYCLIFFVSAWMFILGVLVGRGTAPVHFDMENIENELTALRNEVIQKDRRILENQTGKGFKIEDLRFPEVLKKQDPGKPENEVTFKISEKQPIGQPEKLPVDNKKKVEPARKKPVVPATGKKTSLKAATQKPRTPEKIARFTIQVASLKDPVSANQMVSGLKKKGYPAYIVKFEMKNKGVWYRVRVGGYPTRTDAGPVVNRLKTDFKNPMILEK